MKPPAVEVAGVMRVYGSQYLGLYGDRMPAAPQPWAEQPGISG